MKILYVGKLSLYGESNATLHRLLALSELGHLVAPIDSSPPSIYRKIKLSVRKIRRLFFALDLALVNQKIRHYVKNSQFDVLWIDKGLSVSPQTLREVKDTTHRPYIVAYSTDDMMQVHNQSKNYLRCVPLYDLHVTTNTYNTNELRVIGAQETLFVPNGYAPHLHRPMTLSGEDFQEWGTSVGFVGTYELERYEYLYRLAQSGIKVVIRGNKWGDIKANHPNLIISSGPIWGADYTKAICSTDINLCFLRKRNRDLQTLRSFEIPASGGFMMAERTLAHREAFVEGAEAEFFSSKDELVDKVRYYLAHERDRLRISAAGHQRCINSGYSNHSRMGRVVDRIKEVYT